MVVRLTLCGTLPRVECRKAFFHAGVINAQELVLRSGHADEVRLTFAAFLIKKLVHRLIYGRLLQVSADDLVQHFPQMRRATFCCRRALCLMFAGLVYSRIDASKSNDGTAARKTAYISNLSHKLSGSCLTHAVHGTHGIVLWQLFCKVCHLSA